MKPKTDTNLLCSIFGHNYFKITDFNSDSAELLCNHCNARTTTDAYGNFEESSIPNKEAQAILRRLFLLKRKKTKRSLSL